MKAFLNLDVILLLVLLTFLNIRNTIGFLFFPPRIIPQEFILFRNRCASRSNEEEIQTDLHEQILKVAKDLWGGNEIPSVHPPNRMPVEGEAKLKVGVPFSERAHYFREKALRGYPDAQHSYALLLWNGFGGARRDADASARWHVAAAAQGHLDSIAALGGCLRTETGVDRDEELGAHLIGHCASRYNPTGVNKQAALSDANGAFQLYEECCGREKANALLLFNLGWCLVNGEGVEKRDSARGVGLWREAAAMAPDEGSEEAAWHLYEQYKRDDPREARRWLDLGASLGYDEAIVEEEIQKRKEYQ